MESHQNVEVTSYQVSVETAVVKVDPILPVTKHCHKLGRHRVEAKVDELLEPLTQCLVAS